MFVRRSYRWVLAFVALALIVDCSEEQPTSPPYSEGTPTPLALRVGRSNEFAVDLYHHLSSSETNLILSPHSVSTAFGMVYAGARGVTEREIAEVFHFSYPPRGVHSAMRILNRMLERRGWSGDPESFRLDLANSIWGRNDVTYVPAYLDTIALNYGAGLKYVDFVNRPNETLALINQWVSDQTRGLIRDLLQPGSIDAATVLVLVNTIYFRAAWLHQFDPAYTRNRPFTRLDSSVVSVPLMTGEMSIYYYDGDGFKAAGLPYVGEECTMVLLLPDEGNFESFESSLTAAVIDSIVGELRRRGVWVGLPKFSFEAEYELKHTLKEMGITSAFDPGADLSGLFQGGGPWISFVAHKSFISVNEWGTLAAAGTGVGFTVGVMPEFSAVRPFIFAIRDNETGTILFLGRVLDPSI